MQYALLTADGDDRNGDFVSVFDPRTFVWDSDPVKLGAASVRSTVESRLLLA